MKSFTREVWFETKKAFEFINITPTVEALVREAGIAEGLVLINAMHITASVFVNDDEAGLHQDFQNGLRKSPRKNRSINTDITIRAKTTPLLISGGSSSAGGRRRYYQGSSPFRAWEQIFYGEFDGKRRKRVLVKIIGE